VAFPLALVTMTVTVLAPTASVMGPESPPFPMETPFTVMLKPLGALAETVVVVNENGAVTEYPVVVALNAGTSAPAETDRLLRLALPLATPTEPAPSDVLVSDSQPATASARVAESTAADRLRRATLISTE